MNKLFLHLNVIFFDNFFAKTKICNTFALAKRNIGLWCNGNTTDSGPVILGSNPGSPTKKDDLKVVFFVGLYILHPPKSPLRKGDLSLCSD